MGNRQGQQPGCRERHVHAGRSDPARPVGSVRWDGLQVHPLGTGQLSGQAPWTLVVDVVTPKALLSSFRQALQEETNLEESPTHTRTEWLDLLGEGEDVACLTAENFAVSTLTKHWKAAPLGAACDLLCPQRGDGQSWLLSATRASFFPFPTVFFPSVSPIPRSTASCGGSFSSHLLLPTRSLPVSTFPPIPPAAASRRSLFSPPPPHRLLPAYYPQLFSSSPRTVSFPCLPQSSSHPLLLSPSSSFPASYSPSSTRLHIPTFFSQQRLPAALFSPRTKSSLFLFPPSSPHAVLSPRRLLPSPSSPHAVFSPRLAHNRFLPLTPFSSHVLPPSRRSVCQSQSSSHFLLSLSPSSFFPASYFRHLLPLPTILFPFPSPHLLAAATSCRAFLSPSPFSPLPLPTVFAPDRLLARPLLALSHCLSPRSSPRVRAPVSLPPEGRGNIQRPTGKTAMGQGRQSLELAAYSHGMPRTAGNHQKLRRRFYLKASQRNQSYSHLLFEFLAS
ncbi:uncharacterized protein LOC134738757 [Pongo pygmaeus]|uniref:uncharacterized protein LOC134738757 n=1 Tax=Pongo pygmaeus TaxID=9600 RepID=UPI00300CE343